MVTQRTEAEKLAQDSSTKSAKVVEQKDQEIEKLTKEIADLKAIQESTSKDKESKVVTLETLVKTLQSEITKKSTEISSLTESKSVEITKLSSEIQKTSQEKDKI